jgi:hypothetical protein
VMYKSFYDDGASRRARSLEGNELRDGWRETQKDLKRRNVKKSLVI